MDKAGFVSDCGGLVEQIAFSIPASFLDASVSADDWQPLIPIGNLLRALPYDVDASILVNAAAFAAAEAWLDMLEPDCVVRPVAVDNAITLRSPWIQDSFHVRRLGGENTGSTEILALGKNQIGETLARHLGASCRNSPFDMPGGNQLVGPDFRIVGHNSIIHNVVPRADTENDALQSLEEADERPISVFGFQGDDLLPLPLRKLAGQATYIAAADQRPALRMQLSSNLKGMHQYGFHIDQFVSVTGLVVEGRPLVLVGEPCGTNGQICKQVGYAQQLLHGCVQQLERDGFKVLRNPVPFLKTFDSGKVLPRLYNNILLENAVRSGSLQPRVWLPAFGDLEPLTEWDDANARLWGELGFDPVTVPGFSHLASRNGAVRCISKVLARAQVQNS